MCEIDIGYPKYTTFTKLVQVWNFITFELKVIRHEKRDTIFLCWLLLHLPQTTCGTPSSNYWSGLGGPRKSTFPFGRRNSTHCFSQIPQILSASGTDVIPLPRPHFLSGICYFDICEWHILPARAWTPALMLHLTNPCTKRKVLILTKPKGKIYKRDPSAIILQSELELQSHYCVHFWSHTIWKGIRPLIPVAMD